MELPNWDVTQAAAAYSTLTGILAGFALTAITVVVAFTASRQANRSATERHYLEVTLGWLLTAFFSLLLVSFLYADLSGHDRFITSVDSTTHQLSYGASTIQPLVLGLPASVLFASAAIQLILGVIWLFAFLGLGWLAQFAARVMFWFLLVLCAVFVHSYYDVFNIVLAHKAPPLTLWFWADAIIAILLPCFVFALYRAPHWLRGIRNWTVRRNSTVTNIQTAGDTRVTVFQRAVRSLGVLVSLGLALAVAILFGVWENAPESSFTTSTFSLSGFNWVIYGLFAGLWSLYVLGLPTISATAENQEAGSSKDDNATQHIEDAARVATSHTGM